ncbi:MAG: ABC transporter permease [Theionarchaea archaeon]|nr:ABC transporter permease [Theionarchaea archaeon]
MSTPKWLIVAKNEYRIRTSIIRGIRPYFPYLTIGILTIYVFFIAPLLVNLFIDDFIAFILSQAAVAMVEIILFMVFCYFIIIPITSALREEETGQLEIFLSAPIKSSDVLLGKFLGVVPLYAIVITIITGFFTAVLHPLGLSVVQIGITITIFVVIFLSALWIGTVIAALLRTKLGRTARGKDIGRALAMILALPFVAMYYVIAFGGLLETLADPGASGMVKILLGWLPSSWGTEVILNFASNPGNIAAVWFETVTRFGGLLAFFAAILWVGARVADRAYSLEQPSFISSQAKPDGIFYKTIRYAGGGGSFGTLVVSLFKDYSRRLENISNISYMLGLLVLMIIFIVPTTSTDPDDPPAALMMTMFIFPIITVMVTGEVTVRGRESLYIYRKAPSGEGQFVKAMLLKSWLMAVPIAGVVTAVITFLTVHDTLGFKLSITGLMMLFIAGYVVFVLGLFLLNPPFSEKSAKLWINVMIAVFVSVGLFAVSLIILMRDGEFIGGFLHVQLLHTALSWLVGIVFVYLGKIRLSRIE